MKKLRSSWSRTFSWFTGSVKLGPVDRGQGARPVSQAGLAVDGPSRRGAHEAHLLQLHAVCGELFAAAHHHPVAVDVHLADEPGTGRHQLAQPAPLADREKTRA